MWCDIAATHTGRTEEWEFLRHYGVQWQGALLCSFSLFYFASDIRNQNHPIISPCPASKLFWYEYRWPPRREGVGIAGAHILMVKIFSITNLNLPLKNCTIPASNG
jgi:hypothetical protein